jgi:hypothetical protein
VLVGVYLANSPHDRRRLESALVAEELATLVFLWPPYATFNSPQGSSASAAGHAIWPSDSSPIRIT